MGLSDYPICWAGHFPGSEFNIQRFPWRLFHTCSDQWQWYAMMINVWPLNAWTNEPSIWSIWVAGWVPARARRVVGTVACSDWDKKIHQPFGVLQHDLDIAIWCQDLAMGQTLKTCTTDGEMSLVLTIQLESNDWSINFDPCPYGPYLLIQEDPRPWAPSKNGRVGDWVDIHLKCWEKSYTLRHLRWVLRWILIYVNISWFKCQNWHSSEIFLGPFES